MRLIYHLGDCVLGRSKLIKKLSLGLRFLAIDPLWRLQVASWEEQEKADSQVYGGHPPRGRVNYNMTLQYYVGAC